MRRAWGTSILVLALAAGSLTPVLAAQTLFLDPSSGLAGSIVTARGAEFLSGTVSIRWDTSNSAAIATGPVQKGGTFAIPFPVPAGAQPGDHLVWACHVQTPCTSAKFTVTPPATPKPTPKPTAKPTPRPTPRPTPKPTKRPTSPPTPSATAVPPTGTPLPAGPLFVGSLPGVGVIGDGILGGPATIQIPGEGPTLAGFRPRCEPPPAASIIDFDDVAPGTDIRERYAGLGVHLAPADLASYGAPPGGPTITARSTPLPAIDATSIGSISNPNAIHIERSSGSGGTLGPALRIRFDRPQRLVGLYVGDPAPGLHEPVIRAARPGAERVLDGVFYTGPAAITTCMLMLVPPSEGEGFNEVIVYLGIAGPDLYIDRLFFSDDATYVPPRVVEGGLYVRAPEGPEVDVTSPLTFVGSADWQAVPGDTITRQIDRVLVTYLDDAGINQNREAEVSRTSGRSVAWRLTGVTLPLGPVRLSLFASGPGLVATKVINLLATTPETRHELIEGTFDLQPLGLEVTQGIRGSIAPMGPGADVPETAVHVAGKATIVRAYGRVVWDPGAALRGEAIPTDAWLFGFSRGRLLPGGPLHATSPVIDLGEALDPTTDLARMRTRADLSWNFELPLAWSSAGSLDVMLWVNPGGRSFWRETPTAGSNLAFLRGIQFVPIDPRDMVIYAADYYWRRDGPVQHAQPTLGEVVNAIGWVELTFPLPYGGLNLVGYHVARFAELPCDGVDRVAGRNACSQPAVDGIPVWDNQVFVDAEPDRIGRTGEVFIPLLFSPSSPIGCSGQAGIGGTPLFHAGACGPTMAQEAAHSLSLVHLSNGHREQLPARDRFADDHGQLEPGAMGWDVERRQPVLPGDAARTHVHDFMSYGGGERWVSIDTWDRVAAALQANNTTSSSAGPAVSAGGIPAGAAFTAPGAVLASLRGTAADSGPTTTLAIEPDAMYAIIRSPQGLGSFLAPGGSLRFDASVPGAVGEIDYRWLIDGAEYGRGGTIFVADLPTGRHVLSLEASDGTRSTSSSIDLTADRDADGDGLGDTWEASVGLDPSDPTDAAADTDGDGLPASLEQSIGGDPRTNDTDGDAYADDIEYAAGSSLTDAASIPQAIHGRLGEPIPRLSAVAQPPFDPVPAGIAALAGVFLLGLLLVLFRRRPTRAAPRSG
ncbi:MAG: hypothetical protein ABI620_04065 [Chloroflexota bacterium]